MKEDSLSRTLRGYGLDWFNRLSGLLRFRVGRDGHVVEFGVLSQLSQIQVVPLFDGRAQRPAAARKIKQFDQHLPIWFRDGRKQEKHTNAVDQQTPAHRIGNVNAVDPHKNIRPRHRHRQSHQNTQLNHQPIEFQNLFKSLHVGLTWFPHAIHLVVERRQHRPLNTHQSPQECP